MNLLSEDEHIARAMLLGMRYHGGNGEPFYYKTDHDGTPDPASFIDAHSLEPMVQHHHDQMHIDWAGIGRRNRAKRELDVSTWLK